MPQRAREPTPLELALWRHMTHDVRPLNAVRADLLESAVAIVEPPPPPSTVSPADAKKPKERADAPPRRAVPPSPGPTNVDRRTWQRLQRGQYPISARLDLHGLTQAEAHLRLTSFLTSQHGRGARCVLVITGRGLRSGGALRGETPRWLATPPLASLVLAHAPARVGHGGEGALYVLLRRQRPA